VAKRGIKENNIKMIEDTCKKEEKKKRRKDQTRENNQLKKRREKGEVGLAM
jgi:hypothetical protein